MKYVVYVIGLRGNLYLKMNGAKEGWIENIAEADKIDLHTAYALARTYQIVCPTDYFNISEAPQ